MHQSINPFLFVFQFGTSLCFMFLAIGCPGEGLDQFDFREELEDQFGFREEVEDAEDDAPAEFVKHFVNTPDEIPGSIFGTDIDGDGDTDFIAFTSHSFEDNQIAWYENSNTETDGPPVYDAGGAQDGTGRYFTEHLIVRLPELIHSVSTGDLDGDGDVDVAMAASEWIQGDSGLQQKHRLVWFENAGAEIGKGTADDFAEHVIGDDIECCLSDIQIADMDADGDMDVVFRRSRMTREDTISNLAWYENLGSEVGENTAGEFEEHGFDSVESSVSTLDAYDIDGDGDLDLFGTRYRQQEFVWYENKGINADVNSSIELTEHVFGFGYYKPFHMRAVDMDGDGDLDFLVALDGAHPDTDSYIGWWENLGSELGEDSAVDFLGHTIRIIDGKPMYAVHAEDMDGDGDMDVFSETVNGFLWYENTGSELGENSIGEFVEHIGENDPFDVSHCVPADVDGDGDVDVFSISRDSGVSWHEKR